MSDTFRCEGIDYPHHVITVDVDCVFDEMGEGERCHMANKLFKHGYIPSKVKQYLPEAPVPKDEYWIRTEGCYEGQVHQTVGYQGREFLIGVVEPPIGHWGLWSSTTKFGAGSSEGWVRLETKGIVYPSIRQLDLEHLVSKCEGEG